jgi:adenylate cyclase
VSICSRPCAFALAAQLGSAVAAFAAAPGESETVAMPVRATIERGAKIILIRHFGENDSIFVGDAYLIKGMAGAILWTPLEDHVNEGRTEFSNRELRLDSRLHLPDINDNLEARLILLERRLIDRDAPIRLSKTGRGRFSLVVRAPLELEDVPRGARRAR